MLDFSKEETNVYELIEEDEYEFELKTEWATTKAGDKYINCIFKIRDDVEQNYQNRLVFDGIYRLKSTGEFQYSKIKKLIECLPNPVYSFEDYDEVIQLLSGALIRAKVKIEYADEARPGSKDKNVIGYLSYLPTNHPTKKVVAPTVESVKNQPQNTDVTDEEDIPF